MMHRVSATAEMLGNWGVKYRGLIGGVDPVTCYLDFPTRDAASMFAAALPVAAFVSWGNITLARYYGVPWSAQQPGKAP
jgi:hypothetical protein